MYPERQPSQYGCLKTSLVRAKVNASPKHSENFLLSMLFMPSFASSLKVKRFQDRLSLDFKMSDYGLIYSGRSIG